MKQWYLVIDVRWCHDCNNCFMSCKDEYVGNEWPGYTNAQPRHGHRWMNIQRRERGRYARNDYSYLPMPCQHCENCPLVDAGADTIVLGCTHYPFLADTIQKVAGPDVNLIDPAPAVARHLLDVMGEEGLLSGEKGGKPEIRLMSSGDSRVLRMLAGRLGIPGTQFCPTCP